jgi:hypothetical protein
MSQTRPDYIELGKKTVLLAVLADWVVFPQAECSSLEAVFKKVDSFLDATPGLNQKWRDGTQSVGGADAISLP